VIAEGSKSDIVNIKDEDTYAKILKIAEERRRYADEHGDILSL
jgi:hypothetical protein